MASSKNNFVVYLSAAGRDCGIWDTWSGGDSGAEDQRYTSGGGTEESYGGKKTREPITTSRVYEDSRDESIKAHLENVRGVKNAATIRKQSIDDEGNPVGTATTRIGTILKVTEPEADSNSSDLRMYEVEISPVAK
jgi:hypothetical protein